MKIFYHNDLDGKCAAAVARMWCKYIEFDECELIEINYGREDLADRIQKGEDVVIVDFSFKPEVMEKIIEKAADEYSIVWLDHHKTAMEYKYSREVKGIRDKNFAGCELAWKYFFPDQEMPEAVKLVGDMDAWKWKYGKRTAQFCEGIMLYPHEPTDEIWECLFDVGLASDDFGSSLGADNSVDMINKILKEGETCIKYRDNFCKDYKKSYAFETEFEGHNCLAMNLCHLGSDAFGEAFDNYDIVIAFGFNGNCYSFSLYTSKKDIDVSEIAKKYNGGGHKGAAGFACKEIPFKKKEVK